MQRDTGRWKRAASIHEVSVILALGLTASLRGRASRDNSALEASAPVAEVRVGESRESWTLSLEQGGYIGHVATLAVRLAALKAWSMISKPGKRRGP